MTSVSGCQMHLLLAFMCCDTAGAGPGPGHFSLLQTCTERPGCPGCQASDGGCQSFPLWCWGGMQGRAWWQVPERSELIGCARAAGEVSCAPVPGWTLRSRGLWAGASPGPLAPPCGRPESQPWTKPSSGRHPSDLSSLPLAQQPGNPGAACYCLGLWAGG